VIRLGFYLKRHYRHHIIYQQYRCRLDHHRHQRRRSVAVSTSYYELKTMIRVSHLGDNYHRGNVIKSRNKREEFQPISRAKADRLPRGRRGQHNGLLYDPRYVGFHPDRWEFVVRANESARFELESLVGAQATVVDIQRSPATTDSKLIDITTFAIKEHNLVRTGDGVGGMVGIGDHLGYDGGIHPFVMKNPHLRGQLVNDLHHVAGVQFETHFGGRDVGWEDMLQCQNDLWPYPKPKSARCWDASENLGNSCHTDRDNARSFAVWLRLKSDDVVGGWWFLFPKHGVAVELAHGTWMSWDGREQPHCSAVPQVKDDDKLLSLFASLPNNLCSVFEREQACGDVIKKRMEQDSDGPWSGSRGIFLQLHVGIRVMLRWVPDAPEHLSKRGKRRYGQSHFRWLACRVVALDHNKCTVEVREVKSPYWVHPVLSSIQVFNSLVIGEFVSGS